MKHFDLYSAFIASGMPRCFDEWKKRANSALPINFQLKSGSTCAEEPNPHWCQAMEEDSSEASLKQMS